MASKYYGLDNLPSLMDQPDQVQIGDSTTSADIEVRIDLTKGWTRQGIKIALESIDRKLTSGAQDIALI